MSLERLIEYVRNAERVSAGVTNRGPRGLEQLVRYLWEIISAIDSGEAVIARQVSVESDAALGMPVWYNDAQSRFERGLAGLDGALGNGVLRTLDSAQVRGVVSRKHSDTLADVVLHGRVELDITAAVDGTVTPGVYYLSGTDAGKLVLQTPPVSVPVLQYTTSGHAIVFPRPTDLLERHVHYRFNLTCRPAGVHVPPAPGGRHEIDDPDPGLEGWLPAGHGAFNGQAPAGAVFGYNLPEDGDLHQAWPPLPPEHAYLDWDRGEDPGQGAQGVPLGRNGLCIINTSGIWWMSDCYGDVPWPTSYDSSESSESYSDSAESECPRHLQMAMSLWFSRPNYATDTSVVTSVRSADSRLRVRCLTDPDTAATAGDLLLALDLALTVNAVDDLAAFAIKTVANGGFLQAGPVVSGLFTRDEDVVLVGEATFPHPDLEDVTAQHGLVEVSVQKDGARELPVHLVRLGRAQQEYLEETPYLGLPEDEDTEFTAIIDIPKSTGLVSPRLAYRVSLLGRAAGTLPDLTVTARRIPRPANGLATPLDLPTDANDIALTVDMTATLTSANQYVEAVSDAFEVADGDRVLIRVRREGTDGYAGDVGILRQVGDLTNAD